MVMTRAETYEVTTVECLGCSLRWDRDDSQAVHNASEELEGYMCGPCTDRSFGILDPATELRERFNRTRSLLLVAERRNAMLVRALQAVSERLLLKPETRAIVENALEQSRDA